MKRFFTGGGERTGKPDAVRPPSRSEKRFLQEQNPLDVQKNPKRELKKTGVVFTAVCAAVRLSARHRKNANDYEPGAPNQLKPNKKADVRGDVFSKCEPLSIPVENNITEDPLMEARARFRMVGGDSNTSLGDLPLRLSDIGLPDDQIEQLMWCLEGMSGNSKISEEEFINAHGLGDLWRRCESELRGVSVQHLGGDFLEAAHNVGLTDDSSVHEIEPKVIRPLSKDTVCPRDGRIGSAYVDTLKNGNHGPAEFMLSYTWQHTVSEIVDSLVLFCKQKGLDASTAYVWLCCLCINQHRVQEQVVSTEQFKHEFTSRVQKIGKVLSLLTPWERPAALRRVWCVCEIWMALQLVSVGCTFDIIMPPKQHESFCETLATDFDSIAKSLSDVDLEQAEASFEADKVAILQMVKESIGFHEVL